MAADTELRERPDGTNESEPKVRRGRFDLETIVLGLKSGLIATVVMTVFRMPVSRSPPPPATFWAKYVGGGEPEDHTLVGLVLHLAYGAFGGVLYAVLARPSATDPEVARERRGVLLGVGYGFLLSAFGERVVLGGLLDMDLEPDERFVFLVSHVVYGLTLGTWIGSRSDETERTGLGVE